MSNQSKSDRASQISGQGIASVDALAARALSVVAKRNSKSQQPFDESLAEQLRNAAADGNGTDVADLVGNMLYAGIDAEAIAVQYIPHAARQMGDEWCQDTLSFARVTIGTARLQAALRLLGTEWTARGGTDENPRNAGVIVIVARDSHHTLGAMVLSGQLRRLGLSVRIAIGASTQELQTLFLTTAFDAVLISASEAESLDSLRKSIDVIRQSSSACPPIILGGTILDQDGDIKAATGADLTTKDPFEALEFCGLTRNPPSETSSAKKRS